MNCFEILGISSDADIKTIKKTYAQLVKIHNPEDDPEGYQKVRKAYDECLKNAKTHKNKQLDSINTQNKDTCDFFLDKNENVDELSEDDGYNNYKKQNLQELSSFYKNGEKVYKKVLAKVKVDSFIHRLTDIYSNINTRKDIKSWENVLKDTIEFDVVTYECLKTSVVYFLFTHQYMPHKIYVLFNDYFDLKNDELKLNRNFAADLVEELTYRIESEDNLSYDHLDYIPVDSLDEYLSLRELAYKAVKDGDCKSAENYIKYAYKIYDEDPELLKINAELKYLNFNYKEAELLIKRVLKINSTDKEVRELLRKLNKFNWIKRKFNNYNEKHSKSINNAFNYTKSFIYAVVVLVIVCFALTNMFGSNTVYNDNKSSSSYVDKNEIKNIIESSKNVEKLPVGLEYADSDAEFLMSIINKSECKIKVKDIQATDYYMLKESINDKDGNEVNCMYIDDVAKENMKRNIKSRVYIGSVSENIVLFTDYDKINEVEEKDIKVIGNKIDDNLYSKIKKDNISYGKDNEKWFPDCIFMNVNESKEK